MKVKVQRRSAQDLTLQGFLLGAVNQDTLCVPGYTRLIDSPDVQAAVGGLADIISNATIQLMQNTPDGDVRVRNALSRFMDIQPWAHGTRKDLIAWIVWTMLTNSCGSAFLLPHTSGGLLTELEPMPDAVAMSDDNGRSYYVMWRGNRFDSGAVLHFRRWPDPAQPWRGLGLRMSLHDLANSLRQTSATKKGFMSDKWKPSVIVKVDALADEFADEDGRKRLVDQYLSNSSAGAPWIIPADLMEVQQVKPLSLTDLAIRDSVELDKRAVASLVGVTPYNGLHCKHRSDQHCQGNRGNYDHGSCFCTVCDLHHRAASHQLCIFQHGEYHCRGSGLRHDTLPDWHVQETRSDHCHDGRYGHFVYCGFRQHDHNCKGNGQHRDYLCGDGHEHH